MLFQTVFILAFMCRFTMIDVAHYCLNVLFTKYLSVSVQVLTNLICQICENRHI